MARHGAVFGDVLVAVDPGDLLDQVDLAFEVASPAWRHEDGGFGLSPLMRQPKRFEDAEDGRTVDADADQPHCGDVDHRLAGPDDDSLEKEQ